MISHPNVKINLGLRILRKRQDGYHDLETLFVPYFDIHDTLEIISGDEFSETSSSLFARYRANDCLQSISTDGKLMITIAKKGAIDWDPLSDLCAKAYYLLANDYKLPTIKIFLEKTSPVGAGLGGGSADAAFTLRMLNEQFALKIDKNRLADYASQLGSDCAFFIHNTPMLGQGRGNILTPWRLHNLENDNYQIKILIPESIQISTAEAYSGITPSDQGPSITEILSRPISTWKNALKNDFEQTVFTRHPQLATLKQTLYNSGAIYASMSGSGSALFAIYPKNK